MAFILNIETSTKNCSVSIAEKGKVIALKELNDGNYSHAEKLHPFIQQVLSEANIDINNIDAIAVSKGPGSYTGLRIGVSTAKGLCFALDIPLISVDTLQILASQIESKEGVVIPLIDARRMEVYSAVFSSENKQIRETKAEIIDASSFGEYLKEGVVHLLGDGSEKCKQYVVSQNANFIDNAYPSSKEMSEVSYQKFLHNNFEDVAYFEPFYLKDFIIGSKKQ